jgi:hypothetical protein
MYGARALGDGYETIAYYRGEHGDVHTVADEVNDSSARAAINALADKWVEAKDASRSRELPLAIASLLLGGAMILFAARSMAGREGARSALVQVVLVHAGLGVASYFLTKETTAASTLLDQALREAMARQEGVVITPEWERALHAAARIRPAVATGFRSLASALIVLALTRPRARAFFESVPPQLGEG